MLPKFGGRTLEVARRTAAAARIEDAGQFSSHHTALRL